jgi:bacterioferritin (cytochrome b1)
MGESTDPSSLARALNGALSLLARDAIGLAVAAGTLPGPEGVALSDRLRAMAASAMDDVRQLSARIATLGETPEVEAAHLSLPAAWPASVERLVADARETLAALVEAIPADADDTEGEATEHLLEHVIARKRDDMELLERALR